MDQFLAKYYGTGTEPTPPAGEVEKVASVEVFAKMAADANVDLTKLSKAQVIDLWNQTFPEAQIKKEAEAAPAAPAAPPAPDAEKVAADMKAAAEKELQEKQAAAEKFAEADFLGRVMAHAYVNELKKIAGEMPPQFAKKDEKEHQAHEKAETKAEEKKEEKVEKKEEKKASALDELAYQDALKKVAEAGLDPEVAAQRLQAVYVLTGGELPNGTKVAAANGNVETAVQIRALELLEAAGYPINWA